MCESAWKSSSRVVSVDWTRHAVECEGALCASYAPCMPKSRDEHKRTDGAGVTPAILPEQNVIFMTARSRISLSK